MVSAAHNTSGGDVYITLIMGIIYTDTRKGLYSQLAPRLKVDLPLLLFLMPFFPLGSLLHLCNPQSLYLALPVVIVGIWDVPNISVW